MKKVTIEIDDKYASVLTITAVGIHRNETDVTTGAVDISKNNKIIFDHNGRMVAYNAED